MSNSEDMTVSLNFIARRFFNTERRHEWTKASAGPESSLHYVAASFQTD